MESRRLIVTGQSLVRDNGDWKLWKVEATDEHGGDLGEFGKRLRTFDELPLHEPHTYLFEPYESKIEGLTYTIKQPPNARKKNEEFHGSLADRVEALEAQVDYLRDVLKDAGLIPGKVAA